MRFVQRFSRGGGLGSQQDHSSPVTGTPVDDTPGEGDANDRGNYTVRPSSLFSLGQNCKQVMERMLGLGDASPVKVSNVQALGEDRIRITLTEKDPAPAYLGKETDPSTLVILKLRGPLHEFDQKKDLFRLQTAGLLGCPPDAISFIQATRSGSVRLLVAMPTSCYARLLQLALFQPSVLRALGIFWLQPVCFPASVNVAEAVDVTTVTSILGRACCRTICDSLYDAYQISSDQRVGLSSLSLVSHLHDRLLDAQIPADKVATATNEAHAKLARCLDDIRHASPDGADDGSGQHRQCIAELLALEFETGRAHHGVDISAVAKTVLQSFLGSRDVHLLSASARSTGSSDNTHSVSFLQLASPSYRPISTEAKEALRLDTHALSQDAAAALSASLAKCLAQLCAVQASNVSVRTLPRPQASAQPSSATITSTGTTSTAAMTGGSAPGRFLAILPAMLARYIGEQCRNKDSEVYKTLAQHGVLSVNRLRGPQITLSQSGASRSSIGQSLRRVFSRLGKKNTSGQDVVDAISARREEIVNYHFPSVTTAARFHLAGLRTGDIGQLNIAVVGMQGAGKSSLVNMLASVVSQSTQSPCHVATTASSDEGCTRYVSPGWHFGGVCLVDTPPMVVSDNADAAAVELEMKLWAYGVLEGRLNHNEDMRQLSDERLSEITECRVEARPLAEQIHGLIIVIDEGKIPLNGDLSASNYPRMLKDFYRKFTKNRLRFRGMEPLVVVTNCAKHPSEMYIDAVVQLSRAMHGSRFFLDNQLGKDRQYSDSMQLEALEILSVVTNHAELFILRRQQLEKQQREDATITDSTPLDIMLSKTLSSYGFNKNRLLTMAQTLQSRGINSKRGLLDSWGVARSAIGSNTVLFDKLQEEMRRQHGLVLAQ
ncbi:uncharacterized protein LOC135828566 [Sycon ciliatum]|uniref:uncharacterized protein LOC135828566 n=1 Tax=Sycon ciliatum TaxID=27933 RepID=UPI0031F6186C